MGNKFLRILGFIIAIVVFILVCYRLLTTWDQLKYSITYINWAYLIISIVILALSYAIGFYCWKFLLLKLGVHLSFSKTSAIISVSQIGKYIPGKLWYALGRIYLTKQIGLPSDTVAISLLIEGGMLFLSGLLVVITALFFTSSKFPIIYLLPFTILIIIFIQPSTINFLLGLISKIVKKKFTKINLSLLVLLQILALYVIMWLVHSFGFFILSLSIYSGPLINPLKIMGSFITAWLVGFASIITPGGLGIREGTLSLLLSNVFPPPLNYLVAIIGRFWTTAGEAVLFIIFLPLVRNFIKGNSKPSSQ